MKVYDKREVLVTKKILVKVVCDICKNDIPEEHHRYKVTTGHNDWDNDSCESVEYWDICSDECLQKKFDLYLKSEYFSKYINIEKE
jgi:hypothetical protein